MVNVRMEKLNAELNKSDAYASLYAEQFDEYLAWCNTQDGLPRDTFLSCERLLQNPNLAKLYVAKRDDWATVAQLMLTQAKQLGVKLQWRVGSYSIIQYMCDGTYECMNIDDEGDHHSEVITLQQLQAMLLARFA